jgi:hypothetical protein
MIKRNKRARRGFTRLGLMSLGLVLAMVLCGVGYAHWADTVAIEGALEMLHVFDVGGTIGFWGAWDRHDTYTQEQIETWLGAINETSVWLVPDLDGDGIDISDMEAIFLAAKGGEKGAKSENMEDKFLGHYLATRLNMETEPLPQLNPLHIHDLSECDPDDYLGLGSPGRLCDIVEAIESKYPEDPDDPEAVWPSDDEYDIMKDICDYLNNPGS